MFGRNVREAGSLGLERVSKWFRGVFLERFGLVSVSRNSGKISIGLGLGLISYRKVNVSSQSRTSVSRVTSSFQL